MRLSIKKGRLIDPAGGRDEVTDVHVDQGRIVAIGKAPRGFDPERVIDASGHLILPGIIDLAVRPREPGQEHKATIASETRAAAAGGVTAICCPPDTTPVIDNPAVAELIHQRTQAAGTSRVYCLGALTQGLQGATLAGMHALKNSGCIGVSNARAPINDTAVLRRALEYAATCDLTVHLYCEDAYLSDGGVAHDGVMATRLGLPGIPETAETIALSRALLLIEQTGVCAHFCRLTSAGSLRLLNTAREQGLPVTADVGIVYLYLTENDLDGFNSLCHLRPPLRTLADRHALRAALASGLITAICSDHQPHDEDAKSAPFGLTEPGASTLEVLLPLVMQLVEESALDPGQAIAALTTNPARIAGLDAGHLDVGATADICIYNPLRAWTVTPTTLLSAGKNCPFLGWELQGKVTHTIIDGRIVHEQSGTIAS